MSSTTENKRVLKAYEAAGLKGAAFNFEDFREQCNRYLEQVKATARRILEQAKKDATQIRQKAYEQGKAEGRQDGLKEVDAEINRRAEALAEQKIHERLHSLLPAMQAAAEGLQREYQSWLGRWEASAVRLSVAIAEKLLRHQLNIHPKENLELIQQALKLVTRVERLTVRLNPADVQSLGEHPEQFIRAATHADQVEIVADPQVAPGGCLIQTQYGSIDAQLETILERITNELLQQTSSSEK